MTAPAAAITLSAVLSTTSGIVAVGDVLVPGTGGYVIATTANRAAGGRAHGAALTPWGTSTPGSVRLQHVGVIDAAVTGLGAGTASWVRVSATGRLERAAVSGADDVVGWCHTDGTLFATFGILTAAIVNGGGGGFTAPTGTGFVSVTGGALDGASIKVNLASAVYVTGTLAVGNGGTGFTAFGAGVSTFLQTPSGANLASALTSALPIAKGGTGNSGAASAMAALSIDWTLSGVFTKTLAAGGNVITFANQASGMVIMVRLTGAASTVTWPTVKWAGGAAPTQTASGTDVYTFVHDGTNIYGSVVQAMA